MIKQPPTPARILAMAVFTLSCVGLLLFLWLSFGGAVPLKAKSYEVHAQFPEAANLALQADVRISGVPVGKVVKKEVNRQTARTDVTLELDHQYGPIPKDTKAILRQKTLLGETYVELAPGDKSSGTIPDEGHIANSNVSPTVELDEIFRAFSPKTRVAFQRWMIGQGRAVGRGGQDINDALGNLTPFAENTSTLLQILDQNDVDVSRLVRNTGNVFSALTERRGQLRDLIVNSNRVFKTLADRDRQLQETFIVLPTFLRESQLTLARTTEFAENTNPLVNQLRPAARQLSPTLEQLELLAPDLRNLFEDLDPLIAVSKKGIPATQEFLTEVPPLLAATDPFLRNLNPMLSWLGLYKKEITAFLANDSAATQATSTAADQKTQLHYLRTTNPLNPENLAIYPVRLGTNRSNPYLAPGTSINLKNHLDVFGTYLCTSNPIATLSPAAADVLPQSTIDLVNQFAFQNGTTVPAPPCTQQKPLGNLVNQPGMYPHIEEAPANP